MQIDGVLNFREVAGLEGVNGQVLRPGLLFRSGSFAGISPAGVAGLSARGITRVIDLRNRKEQTRFAFDTLRAGGVVVAGQAHDLVLGELATVLRDAGATPEHMATAMRTTYRRLPVLFAPIYAEMFRALLAHNGPMVVNCSVGKDRTGVGIALLLSALGVAEDAIIAEYDRTNLQGAAIRHHLRHRKGANLYAEKPDALLDPVIRADPDYLRGMFDAVKGHSGSAETFVSEHIGLGQDGIAALRARYLTP